MHNFARLIGRFPLSMWKRLTGMLASLMDYCRYIGEEIRNSDKEKGWEPDEMTLLLTDHAQTHEERDLAKARRRFWQNMMKEAI